MSSRPLIPLVNPLQGTDSHHGFSRGNTLPITAMPFGMNHWSPQTDRGRWFFDPRARKLQGFRCTHQPSPWMGDYAAITLMPQVGNLLADATRRASAYDPERSAFRPDYFCADLLQSGTRIEFTPTERGGIFRVTFGESSESRILIEPDKGASRFTLESDRRTVTGFTCGNSGGVPDGFRMYFVARFDIDILDAIAIVTGRENEPDQSESDPIGICVEFGPTSENPITIRLATSFIGIDQAKLNLDREIRDRSFEDMRQLATDAWEENLGRITFGPGEDPENLRTFYSCLYRTQLFPRIWYEFDSNDQPNHFSPYDGKVHPGVLYTDNGFWDTYRTEYPLLALLDPSRLADILQGWVNAYREGGWFPQWATPGYRACMVGTHIDAVIADAVARDVTNFDVAKAYEGMLKHAYEVGDPSGAFGRIGIEDYLAKGYVTTDHHESVARSLDYAYDDFCIYQVAEFLGDKLQAEQLKGRSGNYRHLYDSKVGFMRGRNPDGSWLEPWDEFQWGSPYVEGGPWQSSWAVQHDNRGLIELLGGDTAVAAKLDRIFEMPPTFRVGVYGFEIHEMTEMACAGFGQYAHSNQPVHHVLYLYNSVGQPWRTQREVRRVLTKLYSPTDLPGDEDNGEMAAWYVLSSLGIFPHCPGHPSWTFGCPLFKHVEIQLSNGHRVTIDAIDQSADNSYVQSRKINGLPYDALHMSHRELTEGATIVFQMSSDPNLTPVPQTHRPFSSSPQ